MGGRGMLLSVCFALLAAATPLNSQGLSPDYYNQSCPDLFDVFGQAMQIVSDLDVVNLPALLRLWAHDAMVSGGDGSILLDSKPGRPAEKDAVPNLTLFGFEAVTFLKEQVELICPRVVSCADILALAAQYAVNMTGGPLFTPLLGRRDGRRSNISDVAKELPNENMTMAQLKANFAAKGLTTADLVALSGAHTIGFAHCVSFHSRIWNYNKIKGNMDPSLDWTLGDQLQHVCPLKNTDPDIVQPLDISTIDLFDEGYYFNLQIQEGILASDQVLYDSPETTDKVDEYAGNKTAFFEDFVRSMIRLGNVGVLTGTRGEIRNSCEVVN